MSLEYFTEVRPNIIHETKKSQIPSTKLQINHKFQYSMTETGLRAVVPEETSLGFGILVIVICLLFGIWDLVLSVIGSYAILEIV